MAQERSTIPGLSVDNAKAFNRMLQTIRTKRRVNELRIEYSDAERRLQAIGFSIPEYMKEAFQVPLGWAEKAYKIPARRMRPDGFNLVRKSQILDEVEEIFFNHHVMKTERMGIESSLELGPSFVFVTPGDESKGEPKVIITARTALDATAELDNRTGKTLRALEITGRTEFLMYLPGETLQIELTERGEHEVTKKFRAYPDRVMVTPYVWSQSLRRPYGKSRITKPVMGFIDTGVRTLLRQEVQAEFYSSPQRSLLGASDEHFRDADGKRISPLKALIGGIWALPDTRDEDTGDLVRAELKQLDAASFQPHGDMMRLLAMQVSGETSIPVAYLGVLHDNPSSADAIRANESDLINMVTDELDSYGASRVQVARDVATVLNDGWSDALDRELRGLQSNWRDPGTLTKSEQADSGLKYGQAFPLGDPEVAMEVYGLSNMQIQRNMRYMKQQQAQQLLTGLLNRQPAAAAGPDQPAPANPPVQ